MKMKVLALTASTALATSTGATFDASGVIENMMNGAANQVYAILGIVAPILGSVTVAIVLVKFGTKWINKIAKV